MALCPGEVTPCKQSCEAGERCRCTNSCHAHQQWQTSLQLTLRSQHCSYGALVHPYKLCMSFQADCFFLGWLGMSIKPKINQSDLVSNLSPNYLSPLQPSRWQALLTDDAVFSRQIPDIYSLCLGSTTDSVHGNTT